MPPQPLNSIRPDAGITFTPESTIDRPEVGAWIAQCIACYSWVETQTSRLFSLLLKLNVEAGVELYNGFGGASLKENGLKILARSRLAPPDFAIIDALLKVIQSNQKTRDKIAHWYWGKSDQIEDGLVLIDPKYILIHDARLADMWRAGTHPSNADYRYPVDKIYVYRIKDLQVDAKAFCDLALLVNKCHGLCVRQGVDLQELREELSKDGRIAERLSAPPPAVVGAL
jgi:hypothetical protein